MDLLQNSRSAFRDWREERGFSIVDVAKMFGAAWQTAYYWDRGWNRLTAGAVRRLADLSGRDLAWATKLAWNRNLGDRCPCGCGFEIVFPDRDKARDVCVKILCEFCETGGKPRIRTLGLPHSRRCERHRRYLGSVDLSCRGCDPYRSKAPLEKRPHAPGCERTSSKRLGKLSHYVRRNTGLDVAKKRWRSKVCTAAANSTRGRQTLVKAYLKQAREVFLKASRESREYFFKVTGFYPHERVPRIESRNALKKLYKACNKLSRDHKEESLEIFDPHLFQVGHETVRGRRRQNSIPQSHGMLRHYAKPKFLAATVRGFCLQCDRPLIADSNRKYHLPCYDEFKLGVDRKVKPWRGPRMKIKNAQKYWAYGTLLDLGEKIDDIRKLFRTDPTAVKDGIKLLQKRLAEPKLYPPKFRERVSRYRALLN